jgi:hypothetical protein
MKKFFLLWLIGALFIALVLSHFKVPHLYPLAKRGVPVCGTIALLNLTTIK